MLYFKVLYLLQLSRRILVPTEMNQSIIIDENVLKHIEVVIEQTIIWRDNHTVSRTNRLECSFPELIISDIQQIQTIAVERAFI